MTFLAGLLLRLFGRACAVNLQPTPASAQVDLVTVETAILIDEIDVLLEVEARFGGAS